MSITWEEVEDITEVMIGNKWYNVLNKSFRTNVWYEDNSQVIEGYQFTTNLDAVDQCIKGPLSVIQAVKVKK